MANKDLYEILGVSKTADEKEIKSAYRKLALQWHPDKHKGDASAEEKFKEINEAYSVLSDKKKRQQYDTFGSAGSPQGFPGGGGFGGFSGFDFNDAGGFADIFESFFGGSMRGQGRSGGKKNARQRGNDIESELEISFEEAVFGVEKELLITKAAKCENCDGTGAEKGSKITDCKECNGTGEVTTIKNTILGQMRSTRTCDACGGEGKIPEQRCGVCHGTSRTRQSEKIHVKIPAGVDNGSVVRISGKGEAGVKGGQSGDLYLTIHVKPSKEFYREGTSIFSELSLPIVQAVLGTEVEIGTLYGTTKIKIPAGTQEGTIFKLKEKGVPRIDNGKKGDHFVKVKVKIPTKLSRKEKQLFEELAKES
jgi:molecular chaperone DnaJ